MPIRLSSTQWDENGSDEENFWVQPLKGTGRGRGRGGGGEASLPSFLLFAGWNVDIRGARAPDLGKAGSAMKDGRALEQKEPGSLMVVETSHQPKTTS